MSHLRHKFKKAWELRKELDQKRTTSEKITEEYLERCKADTTNSFITLTPEKALEKARAWDKSPKGGALAGIPIGLKDLLVTRGTRTTAGSKILDTYIPPYDGTVVKKLEAAGTIALGKLNLDEFAMGSSGENSAYGRTKLPQDPARVPGGSSSGSAAAVAANLAPITVGTDTGGSVRQPASFTGIVGVKPTYGRVSRFGVVAYASSLDQIGPMALDAQDAADLLEAIAGYDEWDSTSSRKPVDNYGKAVEKVRLDKAHRTSLVKSYRVGIPREYFGEGLSPKVRTEIERAIETLRAAGATIVPVELPHSGYSLAVYYVVAVSEMSANLQRYDGVRFGPRIMPEKERTSLDEMYEATRGALFGREVKRRILLGTFALSAGYYDAYYRKACQVRNLVGQDFAKAFAKCDFLLGPTTPTPSFKSGEKSDPLTMYLNDIYTVPVNLAGLPGISMPWGTVDGLPCGLQLIGPAFGEKRLLEACAALECLEDEGK